MSNKTSNLHSPVCEPKPDPTVSNDMFIPCLFLIMFPFALLLNGVAAWVSLHLRSTSTFIVYLKNLVAADLLLTLMLPLIAVGLLPGATVELRALICRYFDVIFFTCLYTSITIMGLISLDRFFKIVRPFRKMLGQNVMFSVVASTLVWVVLVSVTAIPTMILTDRSPSNVTEDFCISLKGRSGKTLHIVVVLSMEVLFWLVGTLVVFCYICITMKVLQSFRNSGSNNSQGKKKTKLRVFLILLVFFVCFLPFHVLRIPFTLDEIFHNHFCIPAWVGTVHGFTIWVSTTNICMDPILYIFLCREYRDKLFDMMKSRGICVGLHPGEREEMSLRKS